MSMENNNQNEREPMGLEEALAAEEAVLVPAASKKGKAGLAAVLLFSLMTVAGCKVGGKTEGDLGIFKNPGERLSRLAHELSVESSPNLRHTENVSYRASAQAVLTPDGIRTSTSETQSIYKSKNNRK